MIGVGDAAIGAAINIPSDAATNTPNGIGVGSGRGVGLVRFFGFILIYLFFVLIVLFIFISCDGVHFGGSDTIG